MIYTEEDLKQAYDMGYNEAVDDVNEYIESCNEEYDNDEDYSAVEDAIMNETKSVNKKKHSDAMDDYAYRITTSGKKLSDRDKKFIKLRAKEARSVMDKVHNRDHNNNKYNIDRSPFDHLRE